MDRERLLSRREEAEEKLLARELTQHPKLDELERQFDDANQSLERILIGDITEWVGRFYRERYHEFVAGDRDTSLCKCANPNCPLKRGELPYRLRRRTSAIRNRQRTGRDALAAYLDSHPEAVVIDEALDKQEGLATTIGRQFRSIERRVDQYVDDVLQGDVEA